MSPAADALTAARFGGRRIPALPEGSRPESPEHAYRLQDEVTAAWRERLGGEFAGYKIACTNAIAQKHLGTDGPFRGRLFGATVHESPASIEAAPFFMRVIEPEFGFRMGRGLPPRATPYSREEVTEAAATVMPAAEIVDSRYEEWTSIGLVSLIADNACHGAWVKGPETSDWRGLDLASWPVRLFCNGKEVASGTGAAVLGHPLNALTWLANKLADSGSGLAAGDLVTTGVCTDIWYANAGDSLLVDFGALGAVDLRFR